MSRNLVAGSLRFCYPQEEHCSLPHHILLQPCPQFQLLAWTIQQHHLLKNLIKMSCFVISSNLAFCQFLKIESFMGELQLTIFPAVNKSTMVTKDRLRARKFLFLRFCSDHGSLWKLKLLLSRTVCANDKTSQCRIEMAEALIMPCLQNPVRKDKISVNF